MEGECLCPFIVSHTLHAFTRKKNRFGNPRRVAAAHGLTGCIYPQRQTNPWLPNLPGQHGYMFLGLEGPAKDYVKFFEPTERALFIQEGPSSWRYYGLYVIQRHADNDLSKEEWEQFDDSVSL